MSLVSPGLVAAGAGLLSPAGTDRPEELLAPEDVAAAVAWLASEAGGYVTGQVVAINGGLDM